MDASLFAPLHYDALLVHLNYLCLLATLPPTYHGEADC